MAGKADSGQAQFNAQAAETQAHTVKSVKPGPGGNLPGAVHLEERELADGTTVQVVTQEGYGDWPVCGLCRQAVEPTGYAMHLGDHDKAALAAIR